MSDLAAYTRIISTGEKFEMRRCEACGHQLVRSRRERPRPELRCTCGAENFTVHDPLWVQRETIKGDQP